MNVQQYPDYVYQALGFELEPDILERVKKNPDLLMDPLTMYGEMGERSFDRKRTKQKIEENHIVSQSNFRILDTEIPFSQSVVRTYQFYTNPNIEVHKNLYSIVKCVIQACSEIFDFATIEKHEVKDNLIYIYRMGLKGFLKQKNTYRVPYGQSNDAFSLYIQMVENTIQNKQPKKILSEKTDQKVKDFMKKIRDLWTEEDISKLKYNFQMELKYKETNEEQLFEKRRTENKNFLEGQVLKFQNLLKKHEIKS